MSISRIFNAREQLLRLIGVKRCTAPSATQWSMPEKPNCVISYTSVTDKSLCPRPSVGPVCPDLFNVSPDEKPPWGGTLGQASGCYCRLRQWWPNNANFHKHNCPQTQKLHCLNTVGQWCSFYFILFFCSKPLHQLGADTTGSVKINNSFLAKSQCSSKKLCSQMDVKTSETWYLQMSVRQKQEEETFKMILRSKIRMNKRAKYDFSALFLNAFLFLFTVLMCCSWSKHKHFVQLFNLNWKSEATWLWMGIYCSNDIPIDFSGPSVEIVPPSKTCAIVHFFHVTAIGKVNTIRGFLSKNATSILSRNRPLIPMKERRRHSYICGHYR